MRAVTREIKFLAGGLAGLLLVTAVLWIGRSRPEADPAAAEAPAADSYVAEDGLLRDAVELEPWFRVVEAKVDARVDREMEERGLTGTRPGRVKARDALKKEILRERHGIEWRTLQEMNPDMMID